jgi:hypothetical protein
MSLLATSTGRVSVNGGARGLALKALEQRDLIPAGLAGDAASGMTMNWR